MASDNPVPTVPYLSDQPTNPAAGCPVSEQPPQDIELTVTISRTNGGVSCRGPIQDQIIALGILEAGKLAIIEYHRQLRFQSAQQDQQRTAEAKKVIDKGLLTRWRRKRP